MNVTFDDTSPYLTFSADWKVEPPNDATDNFYWQHTFHATRTKGASVRITFTGAGIYIYGSNGPGHAKYSVEIDDKIFFNDANSSTTAYQQLLFGESMKNGAHSMVLTHEGSDTANEPGWLDVDYVMVTTPLPAGVSAQSNPGSFDSTDGPPVSSSTTDSGPQSETSGTLRTGVPNDDSSNDGQLTKITSVVLGVILGLVLLAVVGFVVYRKFVRQRTADRAFRYGTATGTSHAPPPPTMHSRSNAALGASGAVPFSPTPAGPFDTPPTSQMAYLPARSASSSPGPSVLQIGRSVALLDTHAGDPGAVSFPRAHSSLSQNTGFSAASYPPADIAHLAQPASRNNSFDALRDSPANQSPHHRQSVLSNSSAIPVGIATTGTSTAWSNQPAESKSKGKEWKSSPGSGQRQTRTWNVGGGAPSIKTFVQVMDE